jgi:O-antigen ligase
MKPSIRRFRASAPGLVLAASLVVVPLIQGGTPRLPTFLLHACLLLFAALAVAGRGPGLFAGAPRQAELPVLALVAWSCVSLLVAPYHHDAEHYFLLMLLYAATFLLLARQRSERTERLLFAGLTGSALFQTIRLAIEVAGSGRQPQGTFDNPNFLAGFLAAAAGLHLAGEIGLTAAPRRDRTIFVRRLAGWLLVALLVAAVIWTRSRGGVLALIVSMTGLLVIRFGWRGLSLPIAAAVLLVGTPNPWRERVVGIGTRDVYAFSRLEMWGAALRMWGDHPVAGVGLGQFQYFSPRYAFPVEGHWARYAKITDNPHSEPLLAAAEMGWPAVAALAWIFAALAWSGYRAFRSGRRRVPWQAAVLAGIGAQAAVDFSLHSPPVALAAVGLLASWVGGERREEASVLRTMRLPARLKVLVVAALAALLLLSARTLIGFVQYLRAGGGPVDLLDEKGALARWNQGGDRPSADRLDRAIWWDPDCAPYHAARGSLAAQSFADTRKRAELEMAFFRIDTAMALNPNNESYPAHRAELLLSLTRLGEGGGEAVAEARADLQRAVTINPVSVALRDKLARTCLLTGDWAGAAMHFGESVRLEPCFLKGYLGLGLAAAGKGDVALAREHLRQLDSRRAACPAAPGLGGYERSLIDVDGGVVDNLRRELNESGEVSSPREPRK